MLDPGAKAVGRIMGEKRQIMLNVGHEWLTAG